MQQAELQRQPLTVVVVVVVGINPRAVARCLVCPGQGGTPLSSKGLMMAAAAPMVVQQQPQPKRA